MGQCRVGGWFEGRAGGRLSAARSGVVIRQILSAREKGTKAWGVSSSSRALAINREQRKAGVENGVIGGDTAGLALGGVLRGHKG